jgi:ribosomal RNA assembly protein
MKTIISDRFLNILKNKKQLEEKLNVKVNCKGKEITIEGSPEKEYIAEKVIDAINFGFSVQAALTIMEDHTFEILNIKDFTTKKDLEKVRGRIIGKQGKSFGTLNQLTKCEFKIKDNKVGIIGDYENIENAIEAIKSISMGTKHSHVYAMLEKNRIKPIFDFGLKEEGKKK